MTTLRIIRHKNVKEIAGEWYCDPDQTKKLARVKRELAELQAEEPLFGWHLETRGTAADWHDMEE